MDVSHQQLFLSARHLEFRAGLLSRLRLWRLAGPERLWTAVQRRTESADHCVDGLAVSGIIRAGSEQAGYDCGMGDRRISLRAGRIRNSQTGMDQTSARTFSDALSA